MKAGHTQDRPTLKAIEFYSGIGGFHYGSTLFNHLVLNKDAIVNKKPDIGYYRSIPREWLHPHPETVYKRETSLSSVQSSQETRSQSYTRPSPISADRSEMTMSDHDQPPEHSSSLPGHEFLPQIEIVESFDINPVANRVYHYNFHRQPNNTDIKGLKVEDIDKYQADLFMMSNPCQPFTRQNEVNLDNNDNRTSSFLHLMNDIIPYLSKLPQYMLFENVENFETSNTCSIVLECLQRLQYETSIFVLTPRQFGIPNQRNRFFLLAKLKSSEAIEAGSTDASLTSDVDTIHGSPTDQPSTQPIYALPTPTTKEHKVINYHLPRFHFIPRALVPDYFDMEFPDAEQYYKIWSNPDENFDIIHSTSLPYALLNQSPDAAAKESSENEANNDSARVNNEPITQPKHNNTIITNDGLKPENYSELNPDQSKQWLPSAIPSCLGRYLIDTTDYSHDSYTAFTQYITSLTPQEERIGQAQTQVEVGSKQIDHEQGGDEDSTPSSPGGQTHNGHRSIDSYGETDLPSIQTLMILKQDELGRKLTKQEKREIRQNHKYYRRIQHSIRQGDQLQRQITAPLDSVNPQSFVFSPSILTKRAMFCVDLSTSSDVTTRCFTKGYANYFTGTGSMVQTYTPKTMENIIEAFHPFLTTTPQQALYKSKLSSKALSIVGNDAILVPSGTAGAGQLYGLTEEAPLHMRGIRYFQPREIANLHMFPPSRRHHQAHHHHSSATTGSSPAPTSAPENGDMDVPTQMPIKKAKSNHIIAPSSLSSSSSLDTETDGPASIVSLNSSSHHTTQDTVDANNVHIPCQIFTETTASGDFSSSSSTFDHTYISSFDFPPEITVKQQFQLLGNSLNVYIIAHLLLELIEE